jgi:hypothetical protein
VWLQLQLCVLLLMMQAAVCAGCFLLGCLQQLEHGAGAHALELLC